MSRATCALMFFALAACAEPAASIVVEVDAEPAVLVRLRRVEVATFDGDVKLDATEVVPGAPPSCLPFSVGVAPAEGHEGLDVGLSVTAQLNDGRTITRRVDTHFAAGTHLWSVVLGADCVDADGCDAREVIDVLPEVDRTTLERRIASTTCRELPAPLECVNGGGCFEVYDPLALLCELPCAAPSEPRPPEEPRPPRDVVPPTLTPCPTGWSEVPASASAPATCEPWTIGPTCPTGQVRFPGETTCSPLGAPCPADGWPATIPAGTPQLFVSPTAAPGGDGSRASPLGTLGEALGRVTPGAVVALGVGTHAIDAIVLDRPITLIGACASETILARDAAAPHAALTIDSPGVALSNLTLRGGATSIAVKSGALDAEALALSQTSSTALAVTGGSAALRAILAQGTGGPAIAVLGGGTLTATRAVVLDATGAAILADGTGSHARLADVDLSRVHGGPDGFGHAVAVRRGAAVHLVRAHAEGATAQGMSADGAGSRLVLEDVLLRRVAPSPDGTLGQGLRLESEAHATLVRVTLEDLARFGIYANGRSTLSVRDVVLRRVEGQRSDGAWGMGVICSSGCRIDGARLHVADVRKRGLELDAGSVTRLADVAILRTRSEATDGAYGHAVVVDVGATVHLAGLVVDGAEDDAIDVAGGHLVLEDVTITGGAKSEPPSGRAAMDVAAGARVELSRARMSELIGAGLRIRTGTATAANVTIEDLELVDVAPRPRTDDGYGLVVGIAQAEVVDDHFATLVVRRSRIRGAATAAVQLGYVDAELEDLVLQRTASGLGTGAIGFGLDARTGARVRGRRIIVEDNIDVGIAVQGPRGDVQLEDVRVTGTTCPTDQSGCGIFHGTGVAVYLDGYVALERFVLANNRQNGFQLNFVGGADLTDGLISNHSTGSYVRAGGFDLARIAVRVRYEDNGENIAVGDE